MTVPPAGDLPPLDDLSLPIIEEFETAWESGRPDIAPHFAKHPDRPLRLLLELVAIELENRVKRGEHAQAEEYVARFPELAADAASVAELYTSLERYRRTAVSQVTVEEDVYGTIPMSPSEKQSPFPFLSPPTAPGSIGKLAHYTIVRSVGQGAFGTVFEAFDEKLHRRVAIKMLSSPELAATSPPRKRFLREARSMAAVSHENVVRVYAVEEQPTPYLVMEYVDGGTLQDRMDAEGPLAVPEIVNISRQVAAALAAAHEIGLIHRDIKPSNVLLERGPSHIVKLTDFGLARAFDDASMTRTGTVVGTPMYMSPEQALGTTVDHRTDLFSLGSLMYVMTSGRLPFRASSSVAVLKRVVEESPRPITEVIPESPAWLVSVISRLHAKKPEDRFQAASEVERLLAKAQSGGPELLEQPRAARPGPAAAARPGAGAGIFPAIVRWSAGAAAFAAIAGAVAWYRGAGRPADADALRGRSAQAESLATAPPAGIPRPAPPPASASEPPDLPLSEKDFLHHGVVETDGDFLMVPQPSVLPPGKRYDGNFVAWNGALSENCEIEAVIDLRKSGFASAQGISPDKSGLSMNVDFNHEERGIQVLYRPNPEAYRGGHVAASIPGKIIPVPPHGTNTLTILFRRIDDRLEVLGRVDDGSLMSMGVLSLDRMDPQNPSGVPITEIRLGAYIYDTDFKGVGKDVYAVRSISVRRPDAP